jgi:tetratricopeptide (TPR) repeat protein
MLQDEGKYEKARPLYYRALGIRERMLSPEHPLTALSLGNLAALLQDEGKYEEARQLYERALAIHDKPPAPDNPDTALSLRGTTRFRQLCRRWFECPPVP